MLEGPDGMRVPYNDLLPLHGRPDAVRDNPVPGEIPAANDVPSPCRGYRDPHGIKK